MVAKAISKVAKQAASIGAVKNSRNVPLKSTTDKYPLGKQLKAIFEKDTRARANIIERAPETVDVVSPELCDDILKYIGPTLVEHYTGCDIIDLHPGACLWSQKVHDLLKPRRHLLMEPDEKYYEPFVKPLLDQSDAYRYTSISGAHPKKYWQAYDAIFNDELLPKRSSLPPNDPALRKPNTSLLVIGSLARRYKNHRTWNNSVHTANMIAAQMAQASQTNSLFHSHGLVRMLLWLPEDTRVSVLPDTITGRFGYAASLDAAAELTEVAGSDRYRYTFGITNKKRATLKHRRFELDLLSAEPVVDRMEKQKMVVPPHRRSVIHQQALEQKSSAEPVDLEKFRAFKTPVGKDLEEKSKSHQESVKALIEKVKTTKLRRRAPLGVPYHFAYTTGSQEFIEAQERDRIGPYLERWCAQIALEVELFATKKSLSEATQETVSETLLESSASLKTVLERIVNDRLLQILSILTDEVYALVREEPLLAWDRRSYEPLVTAEEEFYPRFSLYLLDMQPRMENLADDLMTPIEANIAFNELMKNLFAYHASPVSLGLEKAGPNAAHDLMIPELKNAAEGGRLHVDDLNVRMLTRQHLRQLARAYIEWPFRPTATEIAEETLDEVVA